MLKLCIKGRKEVKNGGRAKNVAVWVFCDITIASCDLKTFHNSFILPFTHCLKTSLAKVYWHLSTRNLTDATTYATSFKFILIVISIITTVVIIIMPIEKTGNQIKSNNRTTKIWWEHRNGAEIRVKLPLRADREFFSSVINVWYTIATNSLNNQLLTEFQFSPFDCQGWLARKTILLSNWKTICNHVKKKA